MKSTPRAGGLVDIIAGHQRLLLTTKKRVRNDAAEPSRYGPRHERCRGAEALPVRRFLFRAGSAIFEIASLCPERLVIPWGKQERDFKFAGSVRVRPGRVSVNVQSTGRPGIQKFSGGRREVWQRGWGMAGTLLEAQCFGDAILFG